jgi:hypothetical protein
VAANDRYVLSCSEDYFVDGCKVCIVIYYLLAVALLLKLASFGWEATLSSVFKSAIV